MWFDTVEDDSTRDRIVSTIGYIVTFVSYAEVHVTAVTEPCVSGICRLVVILRTTMLVFYLTHWGRVTHICVSKLTIISSDNGLSPGRRQAIIWTNAGILLIGPLGTNFSEILIGIQTFSFTKMHLKISSAIWRPFCLGLNVLRHCNSFTDQWVFSISRYPFTSIGLSINDMTVSRRLYLMIGIPMSGKMFYNETGPQCQWMKCCDTRYLVPVFHTCLFFFQHTHNRHLHSSLGWVVCCWFQICLIYLLKAGSHLSGILRMVDFSTNR